MQTQGSLKESDLASLLQTMQSERATGTLTLEDGTDSCSMFFLFGHLFHAVSPEGDGEDVVTRALAWHTGNFHFDPRAKLPAEETIKSSPAELIAAAEEGGEPAGVAAASSSGAPSLRAVEGQTASASTAAPAADASIWSPVASGPDPNTEAPSPWSTPSSVDGGEPAGADSSTPGGRGGEAAPAYAPAEFSPSYAPAEPAPANDSAAEAHSTMPSTPAGGSGEPAPVGSLPIPSGTVQYEGLKSAFVDFPRLLRTLRSDHHTGFIRLFSGSSTGVLLFRDGELVDAEAGDDGAAHGEEAFTIFRRGMDTGDGLIDVVELDSDTVTSVARLLTGPPLFAGLLARFVNFPALLEYLAEERLDGSVIVVGGTETGVILLKQGSVLAAYTAGSRVPLTSTDAVAALATERPARIEVRGDDSSRGGIDAEAVLSRPS
ncbi:MAG: DUF4388 domain-containing protein [Candidatus Dormibacteraeota bacterium]|uniref:DUF4388 domain-containing protein n=2 Tax=Candidatus Aeolococcus gillhamiae TaxID=3127015 RepID=A0A934JSG2_9BACT|nr:DUF4388 domain-containing protein [Candidatus Dormibacteraeota bacterium]